MERFELITRYIAAANDVIDICGADAIETLQVLLKAAHAEAAQGLASAAAAMPAGPSFFPAHHAENVMRVN